MDAIKTIEHEGLKISIHQDQNPPNPLTDWDGQTGKMICFHRRYILGDKHDLNKDDFKTLKEVKKHLIREKGAVVILPLYIYDHSGVTISTAPFSCRWDSGQVGWIYTTEERIKYNYAIKRVGKRALERARKDMEREVKVYNQYLQGDVYVFTVSRGEEVIDSCGGFYGMEDAIEAAKESADHYTENVALPLLHPAA